MIYEYLLGGIAYANQSHYLCNTYAMLNIVHIAFLHKLPSVQ